MIGKKAEERSKAAANDLLLLPPAPGYHELPEGQLLRLKPTPHMLSTNFLYKIDR